MRKIEVGKYLRGIPERMIEGTYFDVLDDTLMQILFIENPTEDEISDFHYEKAQFGFLEENGLLFFLTKLGKQPWVDSPYNKHLAPGPVDTQRPPKGKGYMLTLILANACDSRVVGIRVISLKHDFSNQFMDAIERQPHILRYDEMLGRIFKKYPTSEDMANAGVKEKMDEAVEIQVNENGIGYYVIDASIFKRRSGLTKFICDNCNDIVEDGTDVVVIPLYNMAYCEKCGRESIKTADTADEIEKAYQKVLENNFRRLLE